MRKCNFVEAFEDATKHRLYKISVGTFSCIAYYGTEMPDGSYTTRAIAFEKTTVIPYSEAHLIDCIKKIKAREELGR